VGLAVAAAGAAGLASRALRRGGGTALPGLVAERVAPNILAHLAAQLPGGAIVVTGTNGTTTTSHMLAAMLERAGTPVLRNASGSNLARGLATTLARRGDWLGRLIVREGTTAVFETDEAAIAHAVPQIQPRVVVVTNLFRDQLDRYGEVDTVAAVWRSALRRVSDGAEGTGGEGHAPRLVLNADDPTVAALGGPLPGHRCSLAWRTRATGGPAPSTPPTRKSARCAAPSWTTRCASTDTSATMPAPMATAAPRRRWPRAT
jgi:UDP-N-acetylmuramyl pentapeptide synthase